MILCIIDNAHFFNHQIKLDIMTKKYALPFILPKSLLSKLFVKFIVMNTLYFYTIYM